ncbi:MAG TPA: hypothetical protein VF735_19225 [Pyrinomonadaceae bacterium]|jgi:hypothetical protein
MRATKSFFKREAIFTLLFQVAFPVLGLLFLLIMLVLRRLLWSVSI